MTPENLNIQKKIQTNQDYMKTKTELDRILTSF